MEIDERLRRLRAEAEHSLRDIRVSPALRARTLAALHGPSPSRAPEQESARRRGIGLALLGTAAALAVLAIALSRPQPDQLPSDQPRAAITTEQAPALLRAPFDASSATVRVYFLRADAELELVGRDRAIDPSIAGDPSGSVREAIISLLAGPTPAERAAGLTTEIPAGTRLLGVHVRDGIAYLDFSAELERTAGTLAISALLDQIAHTAAAVDGVERVVLLVEGERVGTSEHPFTGDGFLFDTLP
ncbi:MAG TPA: GerMN domain-containing protein [Limnochordia bacterium]